MTSDDTKKALSKLQALCARKEYCEGDIYRKALKLAEGDEAVASQMLASLVEDSFVDDIRYATAFARDKSALDGWGPVKIKYQLAAKGVRRDAIAAALSEIDEAKAESRMGEVLAAKFRTLREDPDVRLKLLKFALTRGYEYDAANRAVADLLRP